MKVWDKDRMKEKSKKKAGTKEEQPLYYNIKTDVFK
jgi:hypothetical protein